MTHILIPGFRHGRDDDDRSAEESKKKDDDNNLGGFVSAVMQQGMAPSFVNVGSEQINKAWISRVECTTHQCSVRIGQNGGKDYYKDFIQAYSGQDEARYRDILAYYKEIGGKLEVVEKP